MVGTIAIIFLLIPESPWWLVSKGKNDRAAKILQRYNGHIEGYDVQEQVVSQISQNLKEITNMLLERDGCHCVAGTPDC
jgi:hypothetical protein